MARRPTLVVNPATDGVFAAFVQLVVDDDAPSIADFERRVQALYPAAMVHARELADEPVLIWYVYRDGHWVSTPRVPERRGGVNDDARSTGGSSLDRGGDSSRR